MNPDSLRTGRLAATLARIDIFTMFLLATVVLASLFPPRGGFSELVGYLVDVAIMALFFLQGAKLKREAVVAGLLHGRLHLAVLGASFVLFPLLGLIAMPLADRITPDAALGAGLLYLCCLPSTVQSSIAFVSIARGNIAAAVCAASASNLLGIFITPLLVSTLLRSFYTFSLESVTGLLTQLLLPFVLGQLLQNRIGGWVTRHKALINPIDRSAILLMVYSAFGAAVLNGIWTRTSVTELLTLCAFCIAILAIVIAATTAAGRCFGFAVEDRITLIFCGSKKSLVTGVPMAGVLFPASAAGTMVLPLMIFHQLQLILCAILARRYADREEFVASAA